MNIIKHNFSWEDDDSHRIFWKHQQELESQARSEVKSIIDLCQLNTDATKILDVGCGIGYHMREFSSLGCECIGLEVSDFSVEMTKANCQGLSCKVLKMPAKDMLWNEHFDLAIAIRHTLGYMSQEELRLHLEKIRLALKPEAYFILTVPFTLELGREMLPVHRWVESDGIFTLVDKYITEDNIKTEKCVLIDSKSETIEEFYEEQRYYGWLEIFDMLRESGFRNINVLKNFEGEKAINGKEARIYKMQK